MTRREETADAASAWTQRPERSSTGVLRFMTWCSLTLGRRTSRLLLYPIAAYFLVFSRGARAASRDYLRRTIGREPTLADGFRHIFAFSAVLHDRVYWLRGQEHLFDVRLTGAELLAAHREAGRGIVFVGAHFGSFGALHALGESHGLDIRMLMYPDNARMVNRALAAINPSVRDAVITLGRPDAILRVRDHLATGGCVGMLADRNIREGSGKMQDVDLLGRTVRLPQGPFRLAALLRAPVVFMAGMYLGGNRYHVRFAPIADFGAGTGDAAASEADIAAAVHRFAELLADCCHEAPWNWFNFHDFWDQPSA